MFHRKSYCSLFIVVCQPQIIYPVLYLYSTSCWLRVEDSNLRLPGYGPVGLTTDVTRDKIIFVLVGGVGIEPTLTALSGQCLRVYKARPKANISNPPNIFIVKHQEMPI